MPTLRPALLALLISVCIDAAAAATGVTVVVGEPLTEALDKYRDAGLPIAYSSALIRSGQRVRSIPDLTAHPETQVRTLIAPYGLTLTLTESKIWAVTRITVVDEIETEPVEHAVEPAVEEILVTTPRHRLVRDRDSIQSLDTRALDSIPSAGGDLFRAVSTLPGQASDGLSTRQRIRGSNDNEVLYLIDGAQLIEPFHMGDFHSPFSAVNANIVDAVNVYNSGFPSRYGNRSAGVVDLMIYESDEPVSGTIDLNLLSVSAHAQVNSENWQTLVSARRGMLDVVFDLFEEDYGQPMFHDEMLRVVGDIGTSQMTFGLINSVDEIQLNNPDIAEYGESDSESLLAWVGAEVFLSPSTRLTLRGNLNRMRHQREGMLNNPSDAIGELEEERAFDVYRLTADWSQALFFGQFNFGVEYQHHRGKFSGWLTTEYGPLGEPIQPLPGIDRRFDASRSGDMVAVHGTVSGSLWHRLNIELGLRYDSQDIDPVHDTQLSPRFQVSYALSNSVVTFLNLGRYAQHQYLYEIQLDDQLFELADPQLVDQVSFGLRFTGDNGTTVQLELYHKEIRDPEPRFDNLYNRYVLLPELHADRFGALPERARATGMELSASGNLGGSLFWSGSYVLANVEERFAELWRPRPWDQHHAIRVGLDWRRPRWQVGLHTAFHTGWATSDLITETGASVAQYNDTRLKDFVSIDLSAAHYWYFGSSELELYLQLSNMSNRTNIGGYDYSLEGDNWERESQQLLPLLPVIGVKYRW